MWPACVDKAGLQVTPPRVVYQGVLSSCATIFTISQLIQPVGLNLSRVSETPPNIPTTMNLKRLLGFSALVAASVSGFTPPPPSGQPLPPPPSGGATLPQQPPVRIQPTRHTPMPSVDPSRPIIGQPLPGLTTDQLNLFLDGLEDFTKVEDVAGGLGPTFNNTSCVSCHSAPVPGGASSVNVTRFGRVTNVKFDSLDSLGGSLLQSQAILPEAQEVVPREANVVIQRNSTPLFGLGLIDAIPDAAIRAGARTTAVDGVLGRAALVTDVTTGQKRVGRLGWKAQQPSVFAFAADAYLNEMGVTNRFFPTENAPNGNAVALAHTDMVSDPEDAPTTGLADFERVANFMRFLAPPPAVPLTTSAKAGQQLFMSMGCALCHTPALTTGPSAFAAFDRKPVRLYSDLLLHDMGSLGDGIAQGPAGARDMRTSPLWGLRFSAPYLHDGRATTVDQAIRAHDGEGKASRERYIRLTPTQQAQLRDFLLSL